MIVKQDNLICDRIMVYMPCEVQGKDSKLKRPFHEPYRVLNVTDTNEGRLVDRPGDDPSFVYKLSFVSFRESRTTSRLSGGIC